MSLRFTPRDAKAYEGTLAVYLDGQRATPYMQLELQGQGQYPRLTFDVRECVLPPVPLGVRSQGVFNIINNGYDNLELKFRLPADESHLPMEMDFPEGRQGWAVVGFGGQGGGLPGLGFGGQGGGLPGSGFGGQGGGLPGSGFGGQEGGLPGSGFWMVRCWPLSEVPMRSTYYGNELQYSSTLHPDP